MVFREKERGWVEREREGKVGKVKKIRKHASRCLVTCKFFFPLNELSALEPAYLLRERQNSFFDKVSC